MDIRKYNPYSVPVYTSCIIYFITDFDGILSSHKYSQSVDKEDSLGRPLCLHMMMKRTKSPNVSLRRAYLLVVQPFCEGTW